MSRQTLHALLVALSLLLPGSRLWSDSIRILEIDQGELCYDNKNVEAVLSKKHVPPGARMCMKLLVKGPGWSGAYRMMRTANWGNWSDFNRVAFWAYNEAEEAVGFRFTIKSRQADGQVASIGVPVTLQPGPNQVELPFTAFKRDEFKLRPAEVTMWVFGFDAPQPGPIYIADLRIVRWRRRLTTLRTPEQLQQWRADQSVEATMVPDGGGLQARFEADGQLWWPVPRGETIPLQRADVLNRWSGYEHLQLEVTNPGGEAAPVTILLADLNTVALAKTDYFTGQVAERTVEVPPGEQVVTVSLAEPWTTRDGRRHLDFTDIRQLGLSAKPSKGNLTIILHGLSLVTSQEGAGVAPKAPGGRPCPACHRTLTDHRANLCPFCGELFRQEILTLQPPADGLRLAPVADASISARSGGGEPTPTANRGASSTFGVHHYDTSFWEERALMRFELADVPELRAADVRRAQLWLCHKNAGRWGKPYVPPLRIYALDGRHGAWQENSVNWLSQPPLHTAQLIVEGGLYYFPTKWFAFDVTDYVRGQLRGAGVVNLGLRAITAEPCRNDNHMMGHFIEFCAREFPDESCRPFLLIRTNMTPEEP